ncbi:MAG: 5-oxoprolinase subunit PxpA [Saprospiraceae bacterium]|nr:5-oxoprolinase subunit PxpA [Saprospiraceae bacterium]
MKDNHTPLLINCDMGEWDAPHLKYVDNEIMPLIDLSNIACGGHAGSKSILETTLMCAKNYNVKVGAHPGFNDRDNFGRQYLPFNEEKLSESLKIQIDLFLSCCAKINVDPFHIKAHGALYHACNQNEEEASLLLKIVQQLCPDLNLLVSPNSLLENMAADQGITTMIESFIDRQYTDDLKLVARTQEGAVLTNETQAKNQYALLVKGKIMTQSGTIQPIQSTTACIHGDNPNCLSILKAIQSNG